MRDVRDAELLELVLAVVDVDHQTLHCAGLGHTASRGHTERRESSEGSGTDTVNACREVGI